MLEVASAIGTPVVSDSWISSASATNSSWVLKPSTSSHPLSACTNSQKASVTSIESRIMTVVSLGLFPTAALM
jgi:hypothetical protein